MSKLYPKPQTKSVDWSYPSSPNAAHFGHAKAGCWCVELRQAGKVAPRAVSDHATLAEARQAADLLPQPWDRFTR